MYLACRSIKNNGTDEWQTMEADLEKKRWCSGLVSVRLTAEVRTSPVWQIFLLKRCIRLYSSKDPRLQGRALPVPIIIGEVRHSTCALLSWRQSSELATTIKPIVFLRPPSSNISSAAPSYVALCHHACIQHCAQHQSVPRNESIRHESAVAQPRSGASRFWETRHTGTARSCSRGR